MLLTCTWRKSLLARCKGAVDLDAPVADNLRAVAKRLDRDVEDLVVIVLDRPRHEKLIEEIRAAGARIRLIGDGDLSAGISAAVVGTGVHMVMGTGGAPEGVLTAAGASLPQWSDSRPPRRQQTRASRTPRAHGRKRSEAHLRNRRSGSRQKIIFACSGVTDGNLLKGVRFFGEGVRTSSMILTLDERQVRFHRIRASRKAPGHQGAFQLKACLPSLGKGFADSG